MQLKTNIKCQSQLLLRLGGVSPGVYGVAVAGQWLGGGSGVHVASIGPSGRGRFRGVMLLHGRHGGPRAGALGSSCSPLLLIGTVKHKHTHEDTHPCISAHVTTGSCLGGMLALLVVSVNTTNRTNGGRFGGQ